jgi:cytochrome c peroxidase
MFWDGRVSRNSGGDFHSPAGSQLPVGLSSALAAQAMFPVTTRLEMRGRIGDVDRFGDPNELADLDDGDLPGIWNALIARLLTIPEYVELFRSAYPGVPLAELGFQHAANAIAAFEVDAFTTRNSPLDHYLEGDATALSEAQKRGALLFFGKANCGACHLGPHLTDQLFHNIGLPQIGPGFAPEAPQDLGRGRVTGLASEHFQFRTPPLRNVELTGPWMHDGAYTTLEAAVRHYLDTGMALRSYDASQLREDLRGTYLSDPATLDAMAGSIDVLVKTPLSLGDTEVADIVAFLRSLTDPAATDLSRTVPISVPSGLPVED